MDYVSIVFMATGSALGGFLGFLISRKFKGKKAKSIALVIPVLLFSRISKELAKNQSIRDQILQPSRIELFSRESARLLINNKNFRKEVSGMSQQEVRVFSQQQTRKGLKRLSFNDLIKWNDLRIRLAKVNKNVCAYFWTSKISPQEITNTLEKLSDAELKSWLKVSMTALVLELDQSSFTPPPENALEIGIQQIASTMKEDEVVRMKSALQAGVSASKDDACWTMMKILNGAKNFTKKDKEDFLRSLSSL